MNGENNLYKLINLLNYMLMGMDLYESVFQGNSFLNKQLVSVLIQNAFMDY